MGKYDDWRLNQEAFEASSPTARRSTGRTYLKLPQGLKFFKPKADAAQYYQVRFLPFPNGTFRFPVKVHFNVGGYNSVPCLEMFNGSSKCPICEQRKELADEIKSKNGFDRKFFENLDYTSGFKLPDNVKKELKKVCEPFNQSLYTLTLIIDRNNEKAGPQVWAISGVTTIRTLETLMKNAKTDQYADISHVKTGKDVFFKKYAVNGSILETINDMQLDPDGNSPLSKDPEQIDDWMSFVEENPLEDMLNKATREEILTLAGVTKGTSFYTAEDAEEDETEKVLEKTEELLDSGEINVAEVEAILPEKTPVMAASKSSGMTSEDLAKKAAAIRAKLKANG